MAFSLGSDPDRSVREQDPDSLFLNVRIRIQVFFLGMDPDLVFSIWSDSGSSLFSRVGSGLFHRVNSSECIAVKHKCGCRIVDSIRLNSD